MGSNSHLSAPTSGDLPQVLEYPSTQVPKYSSTQVPKYSSIQVPTHSSSRKYPSTQVSEYPQHKEYTTRTGTSPLFRLFLHTYLPTHIYIYVHHTTTDIKNLSFFGTTVYQKSSLDYFVHHTLKHSQTDPNTNIY